MYEAHFGLSDRPFSIAPNPRYLFMSRQHEEAVACLNYGLQGEGGVILLTGEVGTGKTTVCRHMLDKLGEQVDVAYILHPKMSAPELLATICDELRIDRSEAMSQSSKAMTDAIHHYLLAAHAAGRQVVLLIDEAQHLYPDVLEQLRLLTNLETDRRKLMQIILIGQSELKQMLERHDLRQFAQRITARFHLQPLNRPECDEYVQFRLSVAGCSRQLFDAAAKRRLFRASHGVPRLINLMADRSLLGAYAEGGQRVSGRIMTKAIREVRGDRSPVRSLWRWLGVASLVALAGFIVWRQPFSPLAMFGHAVTVSQLTKGSLHLDVSPLPEADSLPQDKPLPASTTEADTFVALFGAWGEQYDPQRDGDACGFAAAHQLQCFSRQGDISTLRSLDRPAILSVAGPQGTTAYVTVLGLSTDLAVLASPEGGVTVPLSALIARSLNAFTLLWRAPAGYSEPLRPGFAGPSVASLSDMMASMQGGDSMGLHSSYFGPELSDRLRAFQRDEGLVADGVAGPETLMRLNRRLGLPAPSLSGAG